ncbi:M23 family metallopeptidase [Paraburkholderia sp.]|uniref:M23 family metallopeptidase n=1 Tax=Paraburkholderia sp. TaxID=1926495 RepID=UPI00239076B2|nr:M23 family metallopeptidase [Paraburkholderia sp.]MDE1182279.1 M23 family metallopeptidase [Paraburkholderia sp.]
MAAIAGTGRKLSSGDVRFVTRRRALGVTLAVACAAAVFALGVGVALGAYFLPRVFLRDAIHDAAVEPKTSRVERDYTIDQLGKLDASVAQMAPRIARLAAQVGALSSFEARLGTPRSAPRPAVAPAGGGSRDEDAEGGPSLPPRDCVAPPAKRARVDAAATRRQLDCLGAMLSMLERDTAAHAMVYAAFPGRMPADGARFGSPFGNRTDPFDGHLSFHPGIDLVAPTGTPILAAAGGRVIFAGQKNGYGNCIEIDHGNGLITRYGHASRLIAHQGDLVLPLQRVADVGSTGRSTGPHLHFEVLVNGAPVDPAAYLMLFGGARNG